MEEKTFLDKYPEFKGILEICYDCFMDFKKKYPKSVYYEYEHYCMDEDSCIGDCGD